MASISTAPPPPAAAPDAAAETRRPQRKRKRWTPEEETSLLNGVVKHGHGAWTAILRDPEFHFDAQRNAMDLKDKMRASNFHFATTILTHQKWYEIGVLTTRRPPTAPPLSIDLSATAASASGPASAGTTAARKRRRDPSPPRTSPPATAVSVVPMATTATTDMSALVDDLMTTGAFSSLPAAPGLSFSSSTSAATTTTTSTLDLYHSQLMHQQQLLRQQQQLMQRQQMEQQQMASLLGSWSSIPLSATAPLQRPQQQHPHLPMPMSVLDFESLEAAKIGMMQMFNPNLDFGPRMMAPPPPPPLPAAHVAPNPLVTGVGLRGYEVDGMAAAAALVANSRIRRLNPAVDDTWAAVAPEGGDSGAEEESSATPESVSVSLYRILTPSTMDVDSSSDRDIGSDQENGDSGHDDDHEDHNRSRSPPPRAAIYVSAPAPPATTGSSDDDTDADRSISRFFGSLAPSHPMPATDADMPRPYDPSRLPAASAMSMPRAHAAGPPTAELFATAEDLEHVRETVTESLRSAQVSTYEILAQNRSTMDDFKRMKEKLFGHGGRGGGGGHHHHHHHHHEESGHHENRHHHGGGRGGGRGGRDGGDGTHSRRRHPDPDHDVDPAHLHSHHHHEPSPSSSPSSSSPTGPPVQALQCDRKERRPFICPATQMRPSGSGGGGGPSQSHAHMMKHMKHKFKGGDFILGSDFFNARYHPLVDYRVFVSQPLDIVLDKDDEDDPAGHAALKPLPMNLGGPRLALKWSDALRQLPPPGTGRVPRAADPVSSSAAMRRARSNPPPRTRMYPNETGTTATATTTGDAGVTALAEMLDAALRLDARTRDTALGLLSERTFARGSVRIESAAFRSVRMAMLMDDEDLARWSVLTADRDAPVFRRLWQGDAQLRHRSTLPAITVTPAGGSSDTSSGAGGAEPSPSASALGLGV
ncbi:hypothetical protein BC828DRAFT_398962 [Blastocladiella britannica]|nr:hypothetical protein BC828DRAFT_398962 [Blastocladiella britannica]